MKYWEAMKSVSEGKKVRCQNWEYGVYVYKNYLGDLTWCNGELYEELFEFNLDENEWELFEE